MQRVVILSAFLTPFRSGAEACVEEVVPFLKNRYHCTIVTARLRLSLPRHDKLPCGVPIRRVGLGLPIDKWLFPVLAPLAVRRLKPDLTHAVLESYAGLALSLVRRVYPRSKRLLTLQSTNTSLFLERMHREADRITAISSALVDRGRELGYDDIALIPNGIPLQMIQSARERAAKVPGRVLYVGRLEPMKGVDTLLDAFAIASRKFPDATLHIVGDGSERNRLEEMAKQLGLTGRVKFLGYLSGWRVYHEYAEAEVFAGLSRSEALGNVFLEAQAAGCAVVATRVGGIPDIVHDDITGLLVQPDDSYAAGAAILHLLSSPDMRERLIEQAERNAERYDWRLIGERYGEVYGELLHC